MREARLIPPVELASEELPCHRLLRDGRAREIRIKPLQEARTQLRLRLASPEAANPALPEQVVTGEDLVGSFAGEDNLDADLPHQAREKKERRGRGSQDRAFG